MKKDDREKSGRKGYLRYPEWPPGVILTSCGRPRVDPDELARAEWLWARRPEARFRARGWKVMVPLVIGLVGPSIWSSPAGQLALYAAAVLVWVTTTASALRQDRCWRSDYGRALDRLFSRQNRS